MSQVQGVKQGAKTQGAKAAVRQGAAKQGKTAAKAGQKVRLPAKELMANRKRMFFGASYLNGVLGGYHRDQDKMLQHAIFLKVDQPAKLKKLSLEDLRTKLAAAIEASPEGAKPFSIRLGDDGKPVLINSTGDTVQ